MNFLPTTRDTIINDGRFTNARTVNNFYSAISKSRDPYELLKEHVAFDALFNSSDRFDPPKCHPETRIAILDHINRWSRDPTSPRLLWIRGGAGAGKSAIAQTLSERWDEDSILAATFYFSRTASGRNEKKRLIPTLAYQLAIAIPDTRPAIEDLIWKDSEIFERNLRTQMKKLIIDSLTSISGQTSLTSKVIIIDGLDECCIDYATQDHEQQQKEILECIHLASNLDEFPLRFLVASRPERQIREIFEHGSLRLVSSRVILENTQDSAADIELYLRCKFEEIRSFHPYLGPSWPSEEVIAQLVAKSSGHFIYAAVVVRYLSSPRKDPAVGLKAIIDVRRLPAKGGPFAELDALYLHILRAVATGSVPLVMDVFRLLIYGDIGYAKDYPLFHHISRMSPTFVAKHLFVSLGKLYVDLIDLHSILDIPAQESCRDVPISFLHASFSEFLTQPSRSEEFYIDKKISECNVLSLSIKHLFLQVLSPDSGKGFEYTESGFACQAGMGLWKIEPDQGILRALKAFVNQDETEFVRYVRQTNISHLGTTRNSLNIVRELYELAHGLPPRPTVLQILKKHGLFDFVPINPAIRYKWNSSGFMDWFCDPNQNAQNPSGLRGECADLEESDETFPSPDSSVSAQDTSLALTRRSLEKIPKAGAERGYGLVAQESADSRSFLFTQGVSAGSGVILGQPSV